MQEKIKEILKQAVMLKLQIVDDKQLINEIKNIVKELVYLFKKDQKLFFCGNGGSAADAQHLATEFSGRFYLDRNPFICRSFTC